MSPGTSMSRSASSCARSVTTTGEARVSRIARMRAAGWRRFSCEYAQPAYTAPKKPATVCTDLSM